MTTEKQHAARKAAGQRLQAWWDRRQLRTVHDRIVEHDACIIGLTVVVVLLSVLVIVK